MGSENTGVVIQSSVKCSCSCSLYWIGSGSMFSSNPLALLHMHVKNALLLSALWHSISGTVIYDTQPFQLALILPFTCMFAHSLRFSSYPTRIQTDPRKLGPTASLKHPLVWREVRRDWAWILSASFSVHSVSLMIWIWEEKHPFP